MEIAEQRILRSAIIEFINISLVKYALIRKTGCYVIIVFPCKKNH